ncbi:MAG: hypothetical protein OXC99_06465 [Chloroflexi bacterium]|nr:hypothetical protein [Chloroflexota bacterium]
MESSLRSFVDDQGNVVRLTDERLRHILERHPEVAYCLGRFEETLAQPAAKRPSRSDPTVVLYYRLVSDRWGRMLYLCLVVKHEPESGFIVTGYLISRVPGG